MLRPYNGFAALSPLRAAARSSLSRVDDAPDGFRAVIGDKQRAILGNRDAHGASPNVAIVHDEARHEIFVFAACVTSLMQGHANDLIAHADRAIPRAVFGSEDVALVFRRELFAVVESQFERRIVGIEDYIRRNDLVFQLGML